MSTRCCAACLALLASAAVPRQGLAEPITYTEQAIATGTLGASDFTNSLVTITLSADTSGITASPGLFANTGEASLTVAGLGQAIFLDPLTAFATAGAGGSTLGITDEAAFADLLDTSLPAGLSYDLATALAPLSGPSLISPNASFATTDGGLTLFLAGDSSFTVTVQDVPEPASAALFTAAAALLGLLRRAARAAAH